ncbi:TetR family transcriptional regulator C-terminal domain-containing protein [Gordonia sp. HY002]|nr:TetR family transcriptional regulator C-terminal domain-containing protein [Gordonia zhenghanii]MCF8572115.1 TetR family transcriptional regulator C-terminal domain-containing protein [Gordonia zhenghanii]
MVAVVESTRKALSDHLAASGKIRGMSALDLMIDSYLLGDSETARSIRAMYVIIVESFTSSPGLQGAVVQNNAMFRRLVSNWIREAVDDGEITFNGDPDSVATVIEGLLRGVLIQHLVDPEAIDLQCISTLSKRIVRDHLHSAK